MGKSAPKNQTVTQKVELPKWVEQASEANYGYAKEIADKLPGAYQGNTVAGLNSDITGSWNAVRDNGGVWQPTMDAAQGATYSAMGYQPQMVGTDFSNQSVNTNQRAMGVNAQNFLQGNVGAYMNPYIDNVEQAALQNSQAALKGNINMIGDNAIRAKAFGGSRQGIMEGAAVSDAAMKFGQLSAQLRGDAYNSAAGMMTNDMNRSLQGQQSNQQAMLSAQQQRMQAQQMNQNADLDRQKLALSAQQANQQAGLTGNQQMMYGANQLAEMGSSQSQLGYRDAAMQEQIGNSQRGYEQELLAQDAARWDANKAAMLEPLNIRLSSLGMSPYGKTTSTTSPVEGQNKAMMGLGGAMSGAGLASSLGVTSGLGKGVGAAAGALLGLFSDENEKTNKQKLGKDPQTGLDIYAYDYRADVEAARKNGTPMPPKRVGPMAQDIERSAPGSTRSVGGKRVVNLGLGSVPSVGRRARG